MNDLWRRTRAVRALAVVALVAAFPASGLAQTNVPDTIDVEVGSKLVDFSKHQAGAQRAFQTMTMNGETLTRPPRLWLFSFEGADGAERLVVRSKIEGEAVGMAPPSVYVFDPKTLALRQILAEDETVVRLTVDGTSVRGDIPGPGGSSRPVDLTLEEPGFFAPLVDLVTESLPKRAGVVYRLPVWNLSPTPSTHRLYEFVRQEDIEVRGRTYLKAWVMEDRATDGTLMSTMWLVDGPPELVRWVMNSPNGGSGVLEQEPGDPPSGQ